MSKTLEKAFPLLWRFTDLDRKRNVCILIAIRLLTAVFLTYNKMDPDEYWQATMPAYTFVYGERELSWEWDEVFRLRNTIYPMYLALWFQAAKSLAIDTNWLVTVLPYLAHAPLVLIGDLFTWKIGKRLITKDATQLAFLFLIFNRY